MRTCRALVPLIAAVAGLPGAVVDAGPSDYQAKAATLQPGDTLRLASGSYSGDLRLTDLNGSAGAWITILGQADGSTVFLADASNNTVEITRCSFIAIRGLTLDGQHLDGPFGVSANGGAANLVHDVLVEGCWIHDYDGSQQTDGISTKTPTWNWTIRGNRLQRIGTGIYLGNSDGSDPFVAGAIEDNLIEDTIGYGMQVKFQLPRPTVAGMPTTPSVTVIRDNVFIKTDRASPDGDRPNLLVDPFPDTGAGSQDRYDIVGNVFVHNPRESLLQASGRVSIHHNLFVDVVGTAIDLPAHNGALKLAHVYQNTIAHAGSGILFATAATIEDAVVGNLVYADTPITGPIANAVGNLTGANAAAASDLNAPTITLGAMDYYPLAGHCAGAANDLSAFAGETAFDRDFNDDPATPATVRGCYAGTGANPGWAVADAIKVVGSSGGTTTGGTTTGGATTAGTTSGGTTTAGTASGGTTTGGTTTGGTSSGGSTTGGSTSSGTTTASHGGSHGCGRGSGMIAAGVAVALLAQLVARRRR